jgi:hypothetical protein
MLVWMRTKGEVEVIGAGFGVPRATAYRYRDEALKVFAARRPTCRRPCRRWPSRAGRTSWSTAS